MSNTARKHFNVSIDLPVELEEYASSSEGGLSSELKLLWLVDLVRTRRLGISKAARLSGLSLAAFMAVLAEHGVATIDVDSQDLEHDLRVLEQLRDAS